VIADLFGIELSTSQDFFFEFFFVVRTIMKKSYIKWPSTNMIVKIVKYCQSLREIPYVVGVVDDQMFQS
jgi:hypothetical protein